MLISEEFRKLRGDYLYHYTHANNIRIIQQNNAVLYSKELLDARGIKPHHITDTDSREIDFCRGYNKYVFLVFSNSHPMIYRKQKENMDLCSIKIDVSVLDMPGTLIADRIATDNSVTLYTPANALKNLKIEHCHVNRVERSVWDEVKKYEILIPDSIDIKRYLHKN